MFNQLFNIPTMQMAQYTDYFSKHREICNKIISNVHNNNSNDNNNNNNNNNNCNAELIIKNALDFYNFLLNTTETIDKIIHFDKQSFYINYFIKQHKLYETTQNGSQDIYDLFMKNELLFCNILIENYINSVFTNNIFYVDRQHALATYYEKFCQNILIKHFSNYYNKNIHPKYIIDKIYGDSIKDILDINTTIYMYDIFNNLKIINEFNKINCLAIILNLFKRLKNERNNNFGIKITYFKKCNCEKDIVLLLNELKQFEININKITRLFIICKIHEYDNSSCNKRKLYNKKIFYQLNNECYICNYIQMLIYNLTTINPMFYIFTLNEDELDVDELDLFYIDYIKKNNNQQMTNNNKL